MLTSTPPQVTDVPQSSALPHFDLGGSGLPIHFLHANGYPPACYAPLFERLASSYRLFGMLLRPLWPGSDPQEIHDWKPFSDDLRRFLNESTNGPVIGLGHSIGAIVTLRAAIQEPSLFRALILIDPVLLSPARILQLRLRRLLGLRGGRPSRLVQGALRRRRRFDSLDQLFAAYRRRQVFRYFSDEHLRALGKGLTRPMEDGGYELAYSPEWEARVYETGMWGDRDLWDGLPRLRMPILFLRGAHTDTFFVRTAEIARRRNPVVEVRTIPDATHLVPLEKPVEVASAIQAFITSAGVGDPS